MLGLVLANATSDNAPQGAYFTLWFPLGLFIITAAITWALYARPHRRVPPRRIGMPAQVAYQAGPGSAAGRSDSLSAGPGKPGVEPARQAQPGESGEPGQASGEPGQDGPHGGDE